MLRRKLSIITVCLNSEKTIERLLNSIDNQKDLNFTHIIIDGGSTDATLEKIKKTKSSTNRRVLSSPDDGIFFAMNAGIEVCETEYFMFLNSDDYFFCDSTTSEINKKLYSSDTDIHIFGILYLDTLKKSSSIFFPPNSLTIGDLKFDQSLRRAPHPSTVYRKSILRFNLNFRYVADFDFTIRNLEFGSLQLHKFVSSVMVRSQSQFSVHNRPYIRKESEEVSKLFFSYQQNFFINVIRLVNWIWINFDVVFRQLIKRLR